MVTGEGWARVAARYDAVHVPLPVLDGYTYLAGWPRDVSVWLNPAPLFRDGSRPLRLGMPQR